MRLSQAQATSGALAVRAHPSYNYVVLGWPPGRSSYLTTASGQCFSKLAMSRRASVRAVKLSSRCTALQLE